LRKFESPCLVQQRLTELQEVVLRTAAGAAALLMADSGIMKTHSRPHMSNDNPFSESHFKTLKYQPLFPSRFGSIEHACLFCLDFFDRYNDEKFFS
jgi:hypothetical protein